MRSFLDSTLPPPSAGVLYSLGVSMELSALLPSRILVAFSRLGPQHTRARKSCLGTIEACECASADDSPSVRVSVHAAVTAFLGANPCIHMRTCVPGVSCTSTWQHCHTHTHTHTGEGGGGGYAYNLGQQTPTSTHVPGLRRRHHRHAHAHNPQHSFTAPVDHILPLLSARRGCASL